MKAHAHHLFPVVLGLALGASPPALASESAALTRCREAISRNQAPLYQLRTPGPVRHALAVIARGCREALPVLSDAARRAARQSRAERAVTLGRAVQDRLPAEAARPGPTGSALEAVLLAKLPLLDGLDEAHVERLDAGTYLFFLVLARELAPLLDGPSSPQRFFHLALTGLSSEDAQMRLELAAPKDTPHLLRWLESERRAGAPPRPRQHP